MGAEPPPGSTKTNLHVGVLPGRLVCGDEGRPEPLQDVLHHAAALTLEDVAHVASHRLPAHLLKCGIWEYDFYASWIWIRKEADVHRSSIRILIRKGRLMQIQDPDVDPHGGCCRSRIRIGFKTKADPHKCILKIAVKNSKCKNPFACLDWRLQDFTSTVQNLKYRYGILGKIQSSFMLLICSPPNCQNI